MMQFRAFGHTYRCLTYADASAKWCALRDRRGFGASTLSGVDLTDNGHLVATISYNGRVWPPPASPGAWSPTDKPLYDPLTKET